jgi:hypothetical protein
MPLPSLGTIGKTFVDSFSGKTGNDINVTLKKLAANFNFSNKYIFKLNSLRFIEKDVFGLKLTSNSIEYWTKAIWKDVLKLSTTVWKIEFYTKLINETLRDALSNNRQFTSPKSPSSEPSQPESAETKAETKIEQEKDDTELVSMNNYLHDILYSVEGIEEIVTKMYKIDKKRKSKSGSSGESTTIEKILNSVGKGLSALGKGFKALGGGIGKGIEIFFTGIANGLKKLSDKKLFIGVSVLLGLGSALLVASKGFKEFASIDWNDMAKGVVGMTLLVGAAFLLGKMMKGSAGKDLILGAAGIAILGGSLWIASKGFQAFADITWETVMKGIVALAALALVAIGLGLVMASEVGAVAIIAGAAAIAILGASLLPAAFAANLAAPAFEAIARAIEAVGDAASKIYAALFDGLTKLFDKLSELDATQLFLIGPALVSIAVGLAALSAGSLVSSFLNFMGGLFGADSPIEKLQKMAALGPGMQILAEALTQVVAQLKQFEEIMENISVSDLFLLGPALASIGLGLVALSAANSASNAMDFMNGLFGGKTAAEKLQELADIAPDINELGDGLEKVRESIVEIFDKIANIDSNSIEKLGPALRSVAGALLQLSAANAASSMMDAAGGMFGGKSVFDKLENISQSASGVSELANALNSMNPEEIDILIEKLKQLDETLAGMHLANFSINASAAYDQKITTAKNMIGQSSTEASKQVEPTDVSSAIPVRVVETVETANKVTNTLNEKTIQDKIETSGSNMQMQAPSTNILTNNISNSGGNVLQASAVSDSSTNNEPLLLLASKGDFSLM